VIPLAHVGGMPVEELLPWLAGPGTGLMMVRAWLAAGRRRHQERDR
jgi:hypothetical protein